MFLESVKSGVQELIGEALNKIQGQRSAPVSPVSPSRTVR